MFSRAKINDLLITKAGKCQKAWRDNGPPTPALCEREQNPAAGRREPDRPHGATPRISREALAELETSVYFVLFLQPKKTSSKNFAALWAAFDDIFMKVEVFRVKIIDFLHVCFPAAGAKNDVFHSKQKLIIFRFFFRLSTFSKFSQP